MILEAPEIREGVQVAIRGDSKTVVDWITAKRGREREEGCLGTIQRQLREWCGDTASTRRREHDWAMNIFREHNKEADAWAENKGIRRQRSMVL